MSDVPMPHRREFSRVTVHIWVELTVDGTVHRDGVVENLSLSGGFFRVVPPPAAGLPCGVRLHLDGSAVEVLIQGRVVRSAPDGCAVHFTEIVGVDSLEHLRNLILYNTHDPARVEQEFHDHMGLNRET